MREQQQVSVKKEDEIVSVMKEQQVSAEKAEEEVDMKKEDCKIFEVTLCIGVSNLKLRKLFCSQMLREIDKLCL